MTIYSLLLKWQCVEFEFVIRRMMTRRIHKLQFKNPNDSPFEIIFNEVQTYARCGGATDGLNGESAWIARTKGLRSITKTARPVFA